MLERDQYSLKLQDSDSIVNEDSSLNL